MSIKDPTLEGERLCARLSIKFVSAEACDQNIYVKGIWRDYGEVWVLRYNDKDEHTLSERLLRFSLFSEPEIPLCIIDDVARLHDWMRDRDERGRGLAVDPVDYTRPFTADGEA